MTEHSETRIHNIALFASHRPGAEIAKFLSKRNQKEKVKALYLTNQDEALDQEIIDTLKVDPERIFKGKRILEDPGHVEWLASQNIDELITVYWPWLLKPNIFKLAERTVNFHPALLPINRGWYPHVHSIIDGSPSGVTLHALDEGADNGDIWAQKEITIKPKDTAMQHYLNLQQEIVELFKLNWENIRNGQVVPWQQDNAKAVYHSKSSVSEYDNVDIEQRMTARELINILRARSFGNKGFAYYEDNGERIYMNLRLSDVPDFK